MAENDKAIAHPAIASFFTSTDYMLFPFWFKVLTHAKVKKYHNCASTALLFSLLILDAFNSSCISCTIASNASRLV